MRSVAHLPATPLRSAWGSVAFGLAAIGLGFGGFGTWAAVAPLDSAAIAPGEVTVDTYRKTVQHLEGGIIGEILVRDGDAVNADDVLLRLDDTRLQAAREILANRLNEALARQARLAAERDGDNRINFPPQLMDRSDQPKVAEIMKGEWNVFDARRQLLAGQIAVLEQRNREFAQELAALDAQQAAMLRQLKLIGEEIDTVEYLIRNGLGQKPRLLALQREGARLEGERGEHLAQMARIRQSISGTDLEIMDLRNQRLEEVTKDLRETETVIHDTREKLIETEDSLRRTVVRAPQSGIVVNLHFHTPGGVVNPGEPILDIVPGHDRLVIQARVRPDDIDSVHPGLQAQIRLTAFKQRITPTVDGEISTVSADRLQDKATGESYYQARIELDPDSLARIPRAQLYPGMPAEVLIITGTRSALDYLISPITNALPRAWREE